MNGPTFLQVLPQLSEALASMVADISPSICAIRVGLNRHVSGLVRRPGVVVTCDQALPAQDSYTVVLASNDDLAAAKPGRRDPVTNLAALQIETGAVVKALQGAPSPAVGELAIVVAANADASPTARLSMVRRLGTSGPLGVPFELDLASGSAEAGFVLNARGNLLGMLSLGPGGEAVVVPEATIARFLDPLSMAGSVPARIAHSGRPWLGLALQPIMLPGTLRPVAGQQSGRMVVSLTPNGPADQAGLRLGDILVAIDGARLTGTRGLRGVLGAERIGTPVEVQLVRDGALRSCNLMVAEHP